MDNFVEERKHLIGLIAYRLGEICCGNGTDGLWISTMVRVANEADNYDFPLEDDGTIVTDIVYDDVEEIAYQIYDDIMMKR